MFVIRYQCPDTGEMKELEASGEVAVFRKDAGLMAVEWSPRVRGPTLDHHHFPHTELHVDAHGLVSVVVSEEELSELK